MKNNTTGRALRSSFLGAKRGFTLIELMVTVTIIAIVSGVMITPFKMLSDGMDTRDRTGYITDMVSSLDDSVSQGKVGSYEAVFTTGSIGFVTNQDWYKQKNRVSLDFDFASHSGVLRKVNVFTGILAYEISEQDRVIRQSSIEDEEVEKTFGFAQNEWDAEYEIRNTLDNSNLESFLIRYYDSSDATDTVDNPIRLTSIESTLTGSGYTALKMENVRGTRAMFGYTGAIDVNIKPDKLTGIKLVFEKDGTPMTVIIGEEGR